MFRVNPRVTLCHIILTILIHKSEKQWKVFKVFGKHLPTVIPWGNQMFLHGCAPQESLNTLRTTLCPPYVPYGVSQRLAECWAGQRQHI